MYEQHHSPVFNPHLNSKKNDSVNGYEWIYLKGVFMRNKIQPVTEIWIKIILY